ncbi:hypothetical protein KIPB_017311, partial [Kipferlia bialata]
PKPYCKTLSAMTYELIEGRWTATEYGWPALRRRERSRGLNPSEMFVHQFKLLLDGARGE